MSEMQSSQVARRPISRSFTGFLREYYLLLVGPLLLLGGAALRGETLFWGTPALQFVPWWDYALDSLRQGVLPLWNPLNGMGAPLLANYQTGFFYPPNWLLLIFGFFAGESASAVGIAWGYLFLSVLHFTLAGLGMALLLRRLGVKWLGQIVGGLAYGLSGYIVARLSFFPMVWVAAWLPWIIRYGEELAGGFARCEEPVRLKATWLKLAATLALVLLAGHAQLAWYSLLLAGVWVLFSGWHAGGWRRALRSLLLLGSAALLGAAIAAVQLVPTFEYLRQSQRADAVSLDVALTYSFWPWRLLTLFAPDLIGNPASGDFWGYASYWEDHLYIGMLPVLLALSSLVLLFKGFQRSRRTPHWPLLALLWLVVVVTFILAMGRFTPVFPFLYFHVPTFDMFQAPARYLLLVAFALPLLAGIASDRWRSPTGKGLYWFRLGTAGTFAVTAGAGLAWLLMSNIQLTFIRAAALAGMWALGFGLLTLVIPYATRKGRQPQWQALVIVWTVADLLMIGWALNPTAPAGYYQPLVPRPPLEQGERLYLPRSDERGLKFTRFLRFGDFRPLEDWRNMRGVFLPVSNLLDGIPSANNFDPLVPEGYTRWIDAIESADPQAQASWLAYAGIGAVERIDVSTPGGVRFDSLEGAARWHWFACAQTASSYEDAWTIVNAEMQSPANPNRRVIVEAPQGEIPLPETGDCGADSQASVALLSEKPDRLALRVNAASSGWLEIMDTWYPGWVAEVNGESQPLYRADGTFRAVHLEPGENSIVIHYRPVGFYFAAMFSILVMFAALMWWIIWGRR